MRGILSHGSHVPHHRLDRGEITQVMGSGGGRGVRSVASFDEDTTTMGVAAARTALGVRPTIVPEGLWFATAEPAYLEKTNATAIHAALRLPPDTMAFDFGGAVRSGAGALRAALCGAGITLVVSSGIRTGRPTSSDESVGGDGAAALLIGDDRDGDLSAEYLGGASLTEEFVDRWRSPNDEFARQWEERFGETRYVPLARRAWSAALADAGVAGVDLVAVVGVHPRAQARIARDLGGAVLVDDLSSTVGSTGAAHAALVLASVLDTAEADTTVGVISVADGVDVIILRTTAALSDHRPARSTALQIAHSGTVSYPRFLQWRGVLEPQPPNRPPPTRVSSSAAARRQDWKYGFVASAGDASGLVHMPPARVSIRAEDHDDAQARVPMADAVGTILTYTVDHLVYSLSPPVVFAVVDWDGGGRMPIELTDVDTDTLAGGDRVEPTFRRLSTADGIHNYFWKARPVIERGP